jgi:hypothetical protein
LFSKRPFRKFKLGRMLSRLPVSVIRDDEEEDSEDDHSAEEEDQAAKEENVSLDAQNFPLSRL